MSVTHAIKVDARKECRNHAKMDEIDGTSLEQVANAHDALNFSWNDEAISPAERFARFRELKPIRPSPLPMVSTRFAVRIGCQLARELSAISRIGFTTTFAKTSKC